MKARVSKTKEVLDELIADNRKLKDGIQREV
jgi:hypothetical protein